MRFERDRHPTDSSLRPEPEATEPGFVAGMLRAIPVAAAILPFGLLFGAVAVRNGLSVTDATLMSAMIFAGASQLVGLELFDENVPAWLIVLSILAVNFRHVLYSASVGTHLRHWRPWQRAVGWFFLTDPQFAESERLAERRKVSFAWYMGLGLPLYLLWVLESYIGARFGALIENGDELGLDYILPLYFFAMLYDFRSRRPFWPVVSASAAGAVIAILTVGSPWHVSIGACCGIAVAVLMAPRRPRDVPPPTTEVTP